MSEQLYELLSLVLITLPLAFGTVGPIVFPYYLSNVHHGSPSIFACDLFSGGILFHIGFFLSSLYYKQVFRILGLKKILYLCTLIFYIWLQTINYTGKMLYIYFARFLHGILAQILSETVGAYLLNKYRDVSGKQTILQILRVFIGMVIYYSISYYANFEGVVPEVDATDQRYYQPEILTRFVFGVDVFILLTVLGMIVGTLMLREPFELQGNCVQFLKDWVDNQTENYNETFQLKQNLGSEIHDQQIEQQPEYRSGIQGFSTESFFLLFMGMTISNSVINFLHIDNFGYIALNNNLDGTKTNLYYLASNFIFLLSQPIGSFIWQSMGSFGFMAISLLIQSANYLLFYLSLSTQSILLITIITSRLAIELQNQVVSQTVINLPSKNRAQKLSQLMLISNILTQSIATYYAFNVFDVLNIQRVFLLLLPLHLGSYYLLGQQRSLLGRVFKKGDNLLEN